MAIVGLCFGNTAIVKDLLFGSNASMACGVLSAGRGRPPCSVSLTAFPSTLHTFPCVGSIGLKTPASEFNYKMSQEEARSSVPKQYSYVSFYLRLAVQVSGNQSAIKRKKVTERRQQCEPPLYP